MDIRSITLGVNWEARAKEEIEENIASFQKVVNNLCQENTFKVRTLRLCLSPVNAMEEASDASIHSLVRWFSEVCAQNNIRWFCVPFSAFEGRPLEECYNVALSIARRYRNAFINFIVSKDGVINAKSIMQTGRFIKDVSRLSNTGYDNFRIGASCNCQAHTPFFPFAYHEGQDGFSIALELPPVFMDIIQHHKKKSIQEIREKIIDHIVPELGEIEDLALKIEKSTSLKYYGIDASLAPFPEEKGSVAQIIESLGVEHFGNNGTLFAISYLTDILKYAVAKSGIRATGFNGVMISLLEDTYVGLRSDTKTFSIDSILAFSSVCGCGLDMIPIPGDTFDEEIASLILDVAALSVVLNKPLGVRLLPIPMKHENDFTDFSYDFLTNSRIKSIKNLVYEHKIFESTNISYLFDRYKGVVRDEAPS